MRLLSPLRIFAVLTKEFTQLRRDPFTFGMMLFIPIMQLIIFGYTVNNDPHHLPAAVLTNDHSPMVNSIVAAVEKTAYLDVKYLPQSEEELNGLIRKGKIMVGITIPPDFTHRVLKRDKAQILVEADASDPTSVGSALNAVVMLPSTALKEELKGAVGNYGLDAPFEVVIHRLYNPEMITSYNIVPGLLGLVLTMTLVMMTAMAVTREVERGTAETLLSTPATSVEVMIGKLIPYVIIGVIQSSVILFLGNYLFSVPFAQDSDGWLALLVGLMLFILGNLSLGYLISTLARNQLQAAQLSIFYFLPSVFLSGFAFPFYGMPRWAQYIGEVLPVTHFIRIVRGALLKGQILEDMGHSLMVLSVFVILVGSISILHSRTTLD